MHSAIWAFIKPVNKTKKQKSILKFYVFFCSMYKNNATTEDGKYVYADTCKHFRALWQSILMIKSHLGAKKECSGTQKWC